MSLISFLLKLIVYPILLVFSYITVGSLYNQYTDPTPITNLSTTDNYDTVEKIIEHKFIKLEKSNITLHINIAGGDPLKDEKKIILFLHGFPESGLVAWRNQIEFFSQQGYITIAPDLRGYNGSVSKKTAENYYESNSAKAVEDFKELITDYYKKSSIFLVGHDFGGNVAWKFSLTYPQLVEKLVIANCPHPQVWKDNPSMLFRQFFFKSYYFILFQIPYVAEYVFRINNFARMKTLFQKTGGSYSERDFEKIKEAFRREGVVESAMNYYKYELRVRRHLKGKLRMPVLLAWGKNDVALLLDNAELSVKKKYCENARVVYFECGHFVAHEKKDEFNEEVLKFLSQ